MLFASKTVSGFQRQTWFVPFVLRYALLIWCLPGLRRKWTLSGECCPTMCSVSGSLPNTLSGSACSYRTIGSTKAIKSCKRHSCKTGDLTVGGN